MSQAGSSRAARRGGRDRSPSRWAIGLAVLLGVLVVFAGLRDQSRHTGSRVSVTAADAATDVRPIRPASPAPGTRGDTEPAPAAGSVAATVPPSPLPDLLFDSASLISTAPKARVDMPEMALRSDTLRPSEPLSGEAADGLSTGEMATGTTDAARPLNASRPSTRPSPFAPQGTWAVDRSACARRNSAFLPLVVDERGARAGSSSCRFRKTTQAGNTWAIAATCRSGQERWTANVNLTLDGSRLIWSSERGTERYRRCR